MPLNQSAMRYYKRIGCHEFEGVANDIDERARIVADLGDHKCLILKHHGLLTAGMADQVNDPVQEDPPEVGVLTLAEQLQSRTEANLGAAGHQL